ncbi:MFS transporter [Actinoplanes sp. NPDC051494]|uniref:MFS transporter n=1 Tax=Actinoplanes sp. NPDC051494 TaxID=3363907 RepID=UPI0037A4FDF9
MDLVLARYTVAASLARLADEGARVAVLLHVLAVGRGAAFGGLLVAALMVPHVLVAPAVGALADRVRHRRLLYVSGLAGYAVCLLGAALCVRDLPVLAFVLAVVAGCCAPLQIGGLTSLLGEIAPGRLPRAFGLDVASYSVAGIAGPAVAALVAGWTAPIWSVVVLSGSGLVAAALVATLRLGTAPPHDGRRGGAVRAIVRRPALAAVTTAATLAAFGQGALPIVAALLAEDHADPPLTGFALSAMAVGSLVSSLLYARLPVRRWAPEHVALVAMTVVALPFAVLVFAGGRWATLGFFAAAGLLTGPALALIMVVRDREAPAGVRTQVFTIAAGLKVTAAAAGVAVAGLVTAQGAVVLLLAVAACHLAAGTAGAVILRGQEPDRRSRNA